MTQRKKIVAIMFTGLANYSQLVKQDKTLALEILSEHAAFDPTNPNKVRSLVGVFARNQRRFHEASGRGYVFLADQLLDIDSRNPQLAGRMATLFNKWKRFDEKRQALMREQLERIAAKPGLTSNVAEVVGRALAN